MKDNRGKGKEVAEGWVEREGGGHAYQQNGNQFPSNVVIMSILVDMEKMFMTISMQLQRTDGQRAQTVRRFEKVTHHEDVVQIVRKWTDQIHCFFSTCLNMTCQEKRESQRDTTSLDR